MCVTESPSGAAQRLLVQAAEALGEVTESGSDVELVALLSTCENVVRRLDRVTVDAVAVLERRGVFAERGYKSAAAALSDLLGWERFEARRRVVAAEQVTPRVGLDAAVLPARLPATAAVFADGRASLRHVETITRVLGTAAAARLSPEQWAGAEAQLAAKADVYNPSELQAWGTALVEALDQDGVEPDDRPAGGVNELHLTRLPSGGGKIKGRFDDAAMFDAIAAVVDAKARPLTGDDDRPAGQRQAEALADVCGYVLDHAPSAMLPDCGGRRPHLTVLVRLEDLQKRGEETGALHSAERLSLVPRSRPSGGPGRRAWTSAARSHRSRCACSAATPRSSRSCWAAGANRWTSGGSPARFRTGCAGPSRPVTVVAPIPAVVGRCRGARSTTSASGRTVARRGWTTW
jgi:5-methylcytosine-specific restriction protein A